MLAGPNGLRGENVNRVDLAYTGWEVSVDYDLTDTFTLQGGYGQYGIKGHYDPFGISSEFAVATGSTAFDNFDVLQKQPFLGFTYDVSDSIVWDLMATWLTTEDRVSPAVTVTPVALNTNLVFTPQRSAHPFSYQGLMINSSFTLNF